MLYTVIPLTLGGTVHALTNKAGPGYIDLHTRHCSTNFIRFSGVLPSGTIIIMLSYVHYIHSTCA